MEIMRDRDYTFCTHDVINYLNDIFSAVFEFIEKYISRTTHCLLSLTRMMREQYLLSFDPSHLPTRPVFPIQ